MASLRSLLFLLPVACAAPVHLARPDHVQERWLPPLVDGRTLLAEIEEQVGPPSAWFCEGRVAAWHLVLVREAVETDEDVSIWEAWTFTHELDKIDESGVLHTVRPADKLLMPVRLGRRAAEYSLVAVFDGQGVMQRHAFALIPPLEKT